MKIAQIAPLVESVPPRLYGGTERIVHVLTEELVRQGHEVTLFASADSVTSARLAAGAPPALRLSRATEDPLPHHVAMLERVRQRRTSSTSCTSTSTCCIFRCCARSRRPR